MNTQAKKSLMSTRMITATGMLAAVSFILYLPQLEISFTFLPSFLKLDFSDLPALIGAFAYGPFAGIVICLIKNLLHIPLGTSNGVGEICNFIIGVALVVPASLIYRRNKNRKTALIGSLIGTLAMGIISVPVNYFITYPFYATFFPHGITDIVAVYTLLFPNITDLFSALVLVNLPFTVVKGLLVTALCFVIYKRLSSILKGKKA